MEIPASTRVLRTMRERKKKVYFGDESSENETPQRRRQMKNNQSLKDELQEIESTPTSNQQSSNTCKRIERNETPIPKKRGRKCKITCEDDTPEPAKQQTLVI